MLRIELPLYLAHVGQLGEEHGELAYPLDGPVAAGVEDEVLALEQGRVAGAQLDDVVLLERLPARVVSPHGEVYGGRLIGHEPVDHCALVRGVRGALLQHDEDAVYLLHVRTDLVNLTPLRPTSGAGAAAPGRTADTTLWTSAACTEATAHGRRCSAGARVSSLVPGYSTRPGGPRVATADWPRSLLLLMLVLHWQAGGPCSQRCARGVLLLRYGWDFAFLFVVFLF